MKNFVLIRTEKGRRYAQKILNSIQWINVHQYPREEFHTTMLTISDFIESYEDGMFSGRGSARIRPENTVIHSRCANPRTDWTVKLRKLEERGYSVVNSVDAIELTSNKLACALHLQGIVPHPKSWEYRKDRPVSEMSGFWREISEINPEYLIAKPLTSLSQGAHVKKIRFDVSRPVGYYVREFSSVPGNRIVIQEYFPYTSMHRVIVIGGRALPYTFEDRISWHPNNWKVSCCLNTTSMRINVNPDPKVLEIAVRTQNAVNGEINFIDIFENDNWRPLSQERFSISEINTACSLNIHERLAQQAGRTDWNIHYRIAKHLVRKAMEE